MTPDERGWCICQLVPGAKYSGSWTTGDAIWLDERPIPSDEEINNYYVQWKAEEARVECLTAANKAYQETIAAGFTYTDGHTYYCNEKGVMDLCMALLLNDNDPEEPVLVLDMNHEVVSKTVNEFTDLAVAVGRYHYSKRQEYWAAIAACGV